MVDLFTNASVRSRSTREQIAAAERDLGVTFPASYTSFCIDYGLGVVDDLFMIYVPRADLADAQCITVRSRALAGLHVESLRQWRKDGMEIGVDVWEGGTPEMARRALFFGESYNGHWIFWDVEGEGEFDIYTVTRGQDVRFAGHTLDAFILGTRTERVKTILGPGYAPLAGRFEGRD